MKKKFYFTFKKKEGFPFKVGYIIIWAEDYYKARDEFDKLYPSNDGRILFDQEFSEEGWNEVDADKWGIKKDQQYCNGEFGKDE